MNRRIKVGVDARPLSAPMSGITRYTLEVLERLSRNPEVDWILYSDRPLRFDLPDQANISVKTSMFRLPLFSTLFAQFMFPIWAKQNQLDVFWSPRHHLPLFLNTRRFSCLVTIHDVVWKKCPASMKPLGLLIERFLMPRSIAMASGILCVSESTANDVSHYFSGKSIVVTPLAATLKAADAAERHGTTGDYFLFVGTIEPRKNLENLLLAFKDHVLAKGRISQLVIAGGNGWGKLNLSSRISTLGLDKHVTQLGSVSDEQLAGLYKNAYCLVMPSWYEGFGLPLVEAMAFSIPMITSNNSSMTEVAGDAALYVDPASVASIRQAMSDIAENSALHETLASNAKKRSQLYSWEQTADRTLQMIKQMCSGGRL